jgi:hypothetical protein
MPAVSSGLTGSSITSSGTKLELTGQATVSGAANKLFTVIQNSADLPFTADFTLEWDALPTGNAHVNEILFMPIKPLTYSDYNLAGSVNNNFLRIAIGVTSSKAYYVIQRKLNGSWTTLVPDVTLTSGQKTPAFRVVMYEDGQVEISVNVANTGLDADYITIWGKANLGIS